VVIFGYLRFRANSSGLCVLVPAPVPVGTAHCFYYYNPEYWFWMATDGGRTIDMPLSDATTLTWAGIGAGTDAILLP